MKKILIIIWAVFWILVIIYLVALFKMNNNQVILVVDDSVQLENIEKEEKLDIYSEYIQKEFLVKWDSMSPLIKDGETVIVLEDYYINNSIEKWDIVLYDFKWTQEPILKSIYVTSDDKVEIIEDYLYINDKELKNYNWEKYNFNQAELKVLWMYIKNGKIPKNSYFIFGESINNSIDSRKFWAVSNQDFMWKIVKK